MLSDEELTRLAGSGSYDGSQETARALLLARLTARRALELYPPDIYPDDQAPQGTYRVAVRVDC